MVRSGVAAMALVMGISVSLARQQKDQIYDASWGGVSYHRVNNGLQLQVRLNQQSGEALLSESLSKAAPPAGRFFTTAPSPPRKTMFLALPPGATVRASISNLQTRSVSTSDAGLLAGFSRSSDSSALIPTYLPAISNPTVYSGPVLSVAGYEWYRGRRLARLAVQPYTVQNGAVRRVESFSASLELIAAKGPAEQRTAARDPEFADMAKAMILNEGEAESIAASPLSWNDTTGSWISFDKKYVKITIPQDGIYRIRYEDLVSVVDAPDQIDPRTFRVFNRGKEAAIFVKGEEDGRFTAGEYLEFPAQRNYGLVDYKKIPTGNEEYPQYLDRYTDTSTYWLTWGGVPGARAQTNANIPTSSDTLTSYTEVAHIERDSFLQFIGGDLLVQQDPRWLPGDVWFMDYFGVQTYAVTFTASQIASEQPKGRVYARFASWAAENVFPAHRVRLGLNSSDSLQTVDVAQYQQVLMQSDVPASVFVNGTNTIRVTSLPTISSVNGMMFDWAEAEYPRRIAVTGDTLLFGFGSNVARGVHTVRVTGLSTQDVAVYKYAPVVKRISLLSMSAAAPFVVTFSDSVSPGDRYMVYSAVNEKAPLMEKARTFANLRRTDRRADYLLVTHSRFLSQANQYAPFIASSFRLQTSVIDVQDVFNEFGYGYPTAESIREFLKATTRWQAPMPSYVLLAGDATYDYKFVMADPNPANRPLNSVPSFGQPVSDPWLAVLDDSSIVPQMYVGRIAVNTPEQFAAYYNNVRSYVGAKYDDWNKRYLFFAGGDPGVPGQVESFRATNENILQSLVQPAPIGGVGTSFYKTSNPTSDFGPYSPDQIRTALDNGGLFISYIGHSGTQTWDNGIGDPSQIQNKRGRLALITDFGCSTAKFAEPNIVSFGELFTLTSSGCAIAYIGNSAVGFTSVALTLPYVFYQQLLSNGIYGIGKAHLIAKTQWMMQSGGADLLLNRVVMLTNTLLGDPVLELAVPRKPNLLVRSSDLGTLPIAPSDEDDNLTLKIPYINSGLVTRDSFTVQIRQTYAGSVKDTLVVRRLPVFADTLSVRYGIRDQAGQHTYAVQFNPAHTLDEIDLTDDAAALTSTVLSNSLKPLRPPPSFQSPLGDIVFLNPAKNPDVAGGVVLEIDTTAAFGNPGQIKSPLGNVTTKFASTSLVSNRSYYWRAGIEGSSKPKSQGKFSFTSDSTVRWTQIDSTAWLGDNVYTDARFQNGLGVQIADRQTVVRVTSSGFVDGKFGAVEINGANILPNTFGRGHNFVLLDSATLAVKDISLFDPYGDGSAPAAMIKYLSVVPAGQIVIDLVIDEGSQGLTQDARNAIKTIGSAWIDSLGYRDSWAIIGRKGAMPGSVPELWKKQFSGRVIIDTTFVRKIQTGQVLSQEIGPVGAWQQASVSGNGPVGSSVKWSVLGIRKNGIPDTLLRDQPTGTVSLAAIAADAYPTMRLLAYLSANSQGDSPALTKWSVTVKPPAELAVNFQTVSVSADSVLEGVPVTLRGSVYNVGSLPARNVSVALTALVEGTGIVTLDTVKLQTIQPDSSQSFSTVFSTVGRRGQNILFVEVDPGQLVNEIYKSNNIYSIAVRVYSDTVKPTMEVLFDGERVLNGDYVSARPTIVVRIFDNSPLPIKDPSGTLFLLDGRKVTLGTSPDSLFETGTGAEKARITVRPSLSTGEHTVAIYARDASGNLADTLGSQIRFTVDNESKILKVFNFPNPFARETYFTYVITGSTLPDDVGIRIYTVAGRLIQDIKVLPSDIRFGLNRVFWDGRDRDGNEIANGVYLYKVSIRAGAKTDAVIQKLAKVR